MEEMTSIQQFMINALGLIICTPIVGYIGLKVFDIAENAWKTNNRKKKWLTICIAYFVISILSGGLALGLKY